MGGDLRYQTFSRRLWAGVIDGLVFEPLSWIDEWIWSAGAAPAVLVVWFVVGSLATLAYSIVLHGLFGQTLGKKITGVKVYDVSGQRLTMRQAVLRDSVLLSLALFIITVDLPSVVSARNPYDPANFAFSTIGVLQLIPLWGSLVWFLVELISMLTNTRRRALHDLIARSVVMRVGVLATDPVGKAGNA